MGFALVGSLVPRALGVGYDAIGDVLNTRLALGAVAVLGDGVADTEPLLDHARRQPVTVGPEDLARRALELMVVEQVERVPVAADGRLVGICTRTDILHVRRHQLEQEQVQVGYRPRRALSLPWRRGRLPTPP